VNRLKFALILSALTFACGCSGTQSAPSQIQEERTEALEEGHKPVWTPRAYTEEQVEGKGPISSGLRRFILPNGLEVLILPHKGAPVVTSMMCYRVGSADEASGSTGISHFLEHMMFKGTRTYGKGEIDFLTTSKGGFNNAATSFDYTIYYFSLAADRWQLAPAIEADRMRNSLLDEKEIESERKVVISELCGEQDSPWGKLGLTTSAVHWLVHPYRNPIVGYRQDVERISRSDLFSHYRKFYIPKNSFFLVVGDIDPEKAIEEVAGLFSSTAPGEEVSRQAFTEPPQCGERRVKVLQDTSLARCEILFHTCRVGDPEDPVLDVISTILSTGRSSRLYQRLVEQEKLVSAIYTENDSRRDPGAFGVSAELREGADPDKVEKIILQELEKLKKDLVSAEELKKAKNIIRADFIFDTETAEDLAWKVGYVHTVASYKYLDTYLDRVASVTDRGIQKAAREFFATENMTVGWSLPQNASHKGIEKEGRSIPQIKRLAARGKMTSFSQKPQSARKSKMEAKPFNVKEHTLPNGLTILFLENRNIPALTLKLFINAGQRAETPGKEGLSNFVANLLNEGTAKRTSAEISQTIESVGGRLRITAEGLEIEVLKEHAQLAFDLASDMVCNPLFSEESISDLQNRVIAEIKSDEDDPETVTQSAFRELVYGKHPYHAPLKGYESSVKSFTREDALSFHKNFYVPANCVLIIVGDISEEESLSLAQKYFGIWEKREPAKLQIPEPVIQPAKTQYIAKDLDQVYICLGHLGIRRENPDYYALLVMDCILGSAPGFTSRLMKRLREEEGLAYAIYSSIAESSEVEPGRFAACAACEAKNKEQMLKGLQEEIEKIRKEKVSEEELQCAKGYLTGSFVFALQTNVQLARQILYMKRFKLGFDYIKRYSELVESVTAEDILRAASKHLQPDKISTVICGPFDQNGNPLKKEEK
jgi:zinc protease